MRVWPAMAMLGSLACHDDGDGRQWCLQVSAAHGLSAGAMAGNRCGVGLMAGRVIQKDLKFFYINKTYAYHIGDKNEKYFIGMVGYFQSRSNN